MAIFDRILNWGKYRPPGMVPPQAGPYAFTWQQMDVPADLGLSTAQQVSVRAVYGCIRVIARSVARAPWNIYTTNAGGNRVLLRNDPLSYLLNTRPSQVAPAAAWREAMVVQAIVHGNSFSEIVYDGAGRVRELVAVPTQWVQVYLAQGGEDIASDPPRKAEPREVIYKVTQNTASPGYYLGAEQVFHLRGMATVDGLMGDSAVARASKAIATAYAIDRFSLNYYANNTMVGGVIEMPPGKTIKDEEKKAAQEEWAANKGGVKNAFKMLFLGSGAKYQPLNHDAAAAQVIEARKQSVEEIATYFGVPLHMLAVSSTGIQGNGKNLNEHGLVFVRDALKPWAVALQQEADYKLFGDRANKTTELDLSEFTRGDELSRAQAAEIWIRSGVKTINEVREEENRNHIEGDQAEEGDLHLVASNLVVLDEEQLSPSPEPTAEAPEGTSGEVQDGEGGPSMAGDAGASEGVSGVKALHRLVLANHKKRLDNRYADLSRNLKNGVLAEKMGHARDWSRQRAEMELTAAGVAAPPNWLSALEAVESGGDPDVLAQALNEDFKS